MTYGFVVARGGVEPPTFRSSDLPIFRSSDLPIFRRSHTWSAGCKVEFEQFGAGDSLTKQMPVQRVPVRGGVANDRLASFRLAQRPDVDAGDSRR